MTTELTDVAGDLMMAIFDYGEAEFAAGQWTRDDSDTYANRKRRVDETLGRLKALLATRPQAPAAPPADWSDGPLSKRAAPPVALVEELRVLVAHAVSLLGSDLLKLNQKQKDLCWAWLNGARAALSHPAAESPAAPVADVLAEVARAIRKFPTWPTDPLHAVAVLGEEFGELTKAVLQSVYEPHKVEPGEVRMEALQTAAMALRFFASLDAYVYAKGNQHAQGALAAAPASPAPAAGRS